jgi:epoxyqueuosine reductase
MDRLRERFASFEGRAMVDSAPVLERSLAAAAGVGWIGQNGCLTVPRLGSYVLLCEIVCNLPLELDAPIKSECDRCGRCVAACPTGALVQAALVDANRCISYLTIECRRPIDPRYWPNMGVRLFGCDACQSACPFNKDLPPGDAGLRGGAPLGGAGLADVLQWTPQDWDAATRGSCLRRARYEMLIRNAVIAAGNSPDRSLIGPLLRLRERGGATEGLASLLDWALARQAGREQ